MEEIQQLHRKQDWEPLMDRYSRLRRILVEVKSEAVGLSEEHIATVQSVILQFNDIQKRLTKPFLRENPLPILPESTRLYQTNREDT